jgi:hypothetical protein
MNKTIPNITNNIQRYLFVFATVFLVLFSSCTVKASVKTLVGIPIKTEQSLPKANRSFSTSSVEKCAQIETADRLSVQKLSTDNQILPIILFTATFLFLFSFRSLTKESKHPVYSGSSKIRSSIPLFLEYRKLIVHFSH